MAVITTPSKFVPSAVESCAQKGVKGVHILSAGFKVSGDAGVEVESQMVAIARKNNMRLVGPNCFGTYCPSGGLTIIPGPTFLII